MCKGYRDLFKMTINDDVRSWFKHMDSVMRHLGAFKMARELKAKGQKFNYRYVSPTAGVPSRTYGARALLNLYAGDYDTTNPTDVEYHSLVVQQNNLLRLYMGMRMAMMLNSGGNTYITLYQTYKVNSTGGLASKGGQRSYNNLAIAQLYNERSQGSAGYPLVIV